MQQQELIAGDSLNFTVAVVGYLPIDGWVLKYRLVPFAAGGDVLDIVAIGTGQTFQVLVPAGTTGGWAPGSYSWTSWVDKAGEIYTIANGQITIRPDPRQMTSGGYDSRSLAQVALANCEAAMATFNATGGKVKKYEIAGRMMEFQTIGDLMTLHSFWKLKVAAEGTAQSIASGMGNPRNLHVRFVRPN